LIDVAPRTTDVIDAVMRLRDVRFHHQGRNPDAGGVDCIGCLVVPAVSLGLAMPDYADYSRRPNPRQLLREIEKRMDRVEHPRFSDVGVCWCHPSLKGYPHHVFWLVPGPDGSSRWMVHAWMEHKRVCYNPYSDPWPENTYGFYRLRGLED
jgi:hypothetical protein